MINKDQIMMSVWYKKSTSSDQFEANFAFLCHVIRGNSLTMSRFNSLVKQKPMLLSQKPLPADKNREYVRFLPGYEDTFHRSRKFVLPSVQALTSPLTNVDYS